MRSYDTCACGSRKTKGSTSCRECWRKNSTVGRFGKMEQHFKWNGGRHVDTNGYIRIYDPEEARKRGQRTPRVPEHILVMERHLGRRLTPDECVHHRDHDRQNNDLSNLELMTKSEHSRLHAARNPQPRSRSGHFVSRAA